MEHLEFTDKLNEFGIQIRSTKIENKIQTIEIPHSFSEAIAPPNQCAELLINLQFEIDNSPYGR